MADAPKSWTLGGVITWAIPVIIGSGGIIYSNWGQIRANWGNSSQLAGSITAEAAARNGTLVEDPDVRKKYNGVPPAGFSYAAGDRAKLVKWFDRIEASINSEADASLNTAYGRTAAGREVIEADRKRSLQQNMDDRVHWGLRPDEHAALETGSPIQRAAAEPAAGFGNPRVALLAPLPVDTAVTRKADPAHTAVRGGATVTPT